MVKTMTKSQANVKDTINERIRHAQILFYSSIISVAVSACVSFVGVGKIVLNAPEGHETAMGGLISIVRSIRLAQSASDNLKKISQDTDK